MAYNQQPNFWDFVNSFDPNHQATGEGVDHHQANPFFPFGFPFGGPPHHRGGRRHGPGHHGRGGWAWGDSEDWNAFFDGGRRTRRDAPPQQQQQQQERNESETMRAESDVPDPAEVTPEDSDEAPPRHRGPPHGHHGPHGRRGRCGGRGGFRRHGHPHHQAGPPPYPGFDFASMINGLNDHPFFQSLRDQINPNATNTRSTNNNGENDIDTFTPPLDLFSTPTSYTLHLAIPGAKKEDVGVNWDPETSTLHIAGVIHRIGDEEFLKTLQGKGERTVGMFERKVELKGDEVDAEGISAKLEDGVLVVTVPKVEKGWTEIYKVEIE